MFRFKSTYVSVLGIIRQKDSSRMVRKPNQTRILKRLLYATKRNDMFRHRLHGKHGLIQVIYFTNPCFPHNPCLKNNNPTMLISKYSVIYINKMIKLNSARALYLQFALYIAPYKRGINGLFCHSVILIFCHKTKG
ncbi:MAG: hypothetical protein PARBA_03822 [Parabacteroides sp.]